MKLLRRTARDGGDNGRQRVALFTNSISVGGMEGHVVLLARFLDRARFEVYGVVPNWGPTRSFSDAMRKETDRIELITPDRRYGRLRQVTEAFRLIRYLRSWRVDTIHMHSTTYRGQATAAVCARIVGVRKVFVTEHLAPDTDLSRHSRLSRDLFTRSMTGVVCVSEKNAAARTAHLYTPADRTIVVVNGVDPAEFAPVDPACLNALRIQYDIPVGAPIVGTVVRFEPEKGLDDLVAAFALVRKDHPDAHLLLVGDGSLREELAAQAEQRGVGDNVRFTGFQDDPRPFLGLMDVFVLPVPVGSMSIGLLEAMAMRRAVVITFGGDGEAVVHGESGYDAQPHDPDSLAHYINLILQDPEHGRLLGAAARARVEDHFSAQRVAQSLGELYLGGHNGAAERSPDAR